MAKLSYSQAIRETIAQEMRRDERVFVMGEDVEKLGGVYGCTRGLYKEFGTDRVRNTPISESAIIGAKACPLPFNLGLEQAVLPSVKDIVDACKASLYR